MSNDSKSTDRPRFVRPVPPMIIVKVQLPPARLVERLDSLSRRTGMTRNEVAAMLLEWTLNAKAHPAELPPQTVTKDDQASAKTLEIPVRPELNLQLIDFSRRSSLTKPQVAVLLLEEIEPSAADGVLAPAVQALDKLHRQRLLDLDTVIAPGSNRVPLQP